MNNLSYNQNNNKKEYILKYMQIKGNSIFRKFIIKFNFN